ncbi:TRAP transporter substrate-binding protein [Kerstersia similis]|uniref:TRAP transporter substrate-binding protein n=1 Tax=Kerstersia similis TaxID=206505 RepID=UPI0039EE502E
MKLLSKAAGVCAVTLIAAAPVQAQDVTLKIAHFLPSNSNAQVNVIEPWCEQLGAESNGRIKCQIYPSLQLGGTAATLPDQARNGVADIVWMGPGFSTGKFPRTEVLELPFILPTGNEASNKLIWQFYNDHLKDEYKAYEVLAMFTGGGMDLHMRNQPVRKLEDIKGKKVRASHRVGANILEAWGAAPVSMPPAQMTEAISKGVVDGALASWEVVPSTKLDEVTQYHSAIAEGDPAISHTILAMVMNKRKYDQMPADLREILDRNSGDALVQRFGVAWDKFTRDAKAASAPGSLIDIAPEDYAALQQAAAGVSQDWVKDASRRGINAAELLEAAQKLTAPAQ